MKAESRFTKNNTLAVKGIAISYSNFSLSRSWSISPGMAALSDVPEMRLIMKMAFFFIFINAINKAQR